MGDENPDYGDRVRYIDSDGEEFPAIILEPLPDEEYVTLAFTDKDPREGYVGPRWSVETSVHPHPDTGIRVSYEPETHAFKLGWE